jgi:hypothetical protein
MKKHFVVLYLLATVAQGQVSDYDKLTFKFTPTSLITPQTPAWQFGAEYRPRIDFGLQTDIASNIGKLRYFEPCTFCSGTNQTGINYKWRIEARWYFMPERRNTFFWAQEFFVVTNNYNNFGGYARRDTSYYKVASAEVRTVGIGMATKLGYYFRLSSRWRGEVYFGVGIRHSSREVAPRGEKLIGNYEPFFEDIFDLSKPKETYVLPHISAGVRVCYVLWKFSPSSKN